MNGEPDRRHSCSAIVSDLLPSLPSQSDTPKDPKAKVGLQLKRSSSVSDFSLAARTPVREEEATTLVFVWILDPAEEIGVGAGVCIVVCGGSGLAFRLVTLLGLLHHRLGVLGRRVVRRRRHPPWAVGPWARRCCPSKNRSQHFALFTPSLSLGGQ
ncbi:uncharacterized protein LOC121050042 [Rosa chinensis]|uniref:uncharacterized protein LOC121050042 n=1 Tax=Rosa chinensis TaxID=74649 RepID=UPI001AD9273E|nr:uncharacterized protein LOC121050042 [Rosa chinensis]